MSFRAWRQQLRLLRAMEMLAAGQSVTTVALDLGYDSPSAFIHAFRRALGKTPRAYFGAAAP
jgi:AraC-like DNA-binding protein